MKQIMRIETAKTREEEPDMPYFVPRKCAWDFSSRMDFDVSPVQFEYKLYSIRDVMDFLSIRNVYPHNNTIKIGFIGRYQ